MSAKLAICDTLESSFEFQQGDYSFAYATTCQWISGSKHIDGHFVDHLLLLPPAVVLDNAARFSFAGAAAALMGGVALLQACSVDTSAGRKFFIGILLHVRRRRNGTWSRPCKQRVNLKGAYCAGMSRTSRRSKAVFLVALVGVYRQLLGRY